MYAWTLPQNENETYKDVVHRKIKDNGNNSNEPTAKMYTNSNTHINDIQRLMCRNMFLRWYAECQESHLNISFLLSFILSFQLCV